ncbi:hypothetical protein DFJ73DRAFT_854661 [Zopfochytrium polystomum]|nr:hypothetical protein DFJ73DRAFT_854661 [Zopfochytrium polystomum]
MDGFRLWPYRSVPPAFPYVSTLLPVDTDTDRIGGTGDGYSTDMGWKDSSDDRLGGAKGLWPMTETAPATLPTLPTTSPLEGVVAPPMAARGSVGTRTSTSTPIPPTASMSIKSRSAALFIGPFTHMHLPASSTTVRSTTSSSCMDDVIAANAGLLGCRMLSVGSRVGFVAERLLTRKSSRGLLWLRFRPRALSMAEMEKVREETGKEESLKGIENGMAEPSTRQLRKRGLEL